MYVYLYLCVSVYIYVHLYFHSDDRFKSRLFGNEYIPCDRSLERVHTLWQKRPIKETICCKRDPFQDSCHRVCTLWKRIYTM